MTESTPPSEQPPVRWEAPPPPRSDGGFGFSVADFFNFRYLITPAFIRVIYVIGVIVIALSSIGYVQMPAAAGSGLLYVVLVLVIGNLWWRIVLELAMVLFRINDSLQEIERRGRGM